MTIARGVERREAARTVAFFAVLFALLYVSAFRFHAGRPDFFYLAEAFLNGRIWLESALGPDDVVTIGEKVFVPFAPFPAFVLAPLVAIVGAEMAASWEAVVNAALATVGLALLWRLAGRLGVESRADRVWLVILFGFSTATWWVAMRGGVWHTGQLIASILTFAGLLEAFGRRRALVMGLLAGAGFLTRAPLLLALPYWAWRALPGATRERLPADLGGAVRLAVPRLGWLAVGFAPALAFALWYNAARFGSPLESGYGLATLPAFLEARRQLGLFSLAHLAMNLDYLFFYLGQSLPSFPFFKPDGQGFSILVTSPGLLLGLRADWRRRETIALGVTALLVLAPSLLYYGGGWWQFGYRYALDCLPFVMALCALAAARRGIGWGWRLVILFGVLVNLYGVYWNYNP